MNHSFVFLKSGRVETSTEETISYVLNKKYKVLKTEGNFNNEIGLPLTVFRLRDDEEGAVLEMGISDFGEMDRLSKIAQPDISVITNIGLCHLENLKTRRLRKLLLMQFRDAPQTMWLRQQYQ